MTINSSVPFLLLLAAPVAAQGGTCPDMVTREIPGKSEVLGAHRCGAGITGNIGGLQLNLDSAVCPSLLVVTGPRNEPESRPGSGTYVEQGGTAESRAFVYQCTAHKFLIFPLSDTCDFVSSYVLATLPVYTVRRCERNPQS